MEGVLKQWKEEEAAEVEKESLVKRQAHHHMHVTNTTITTSKLEVQGMVSAIEQTNGTSGLKQEQEIIQTEVNCGDIEKKTNLHPLDPLIHVDSSMFSSVRTESERVGIITENVQQQKELYLEGLYQKTPTQGFYCPTCRTCIQTVLLLEETSAPAPRPPPRCSSCFSFLIPIGSWLFPWWVQDSEIPTIQGELTTEDHLKGKLSDGRTQVKGKFPLGPPKTPQIPVQAPGHVKNNEEDKPSDPSSSSCEIPEDEHDHDGPKIKPSSGGLLFGVPTPDTPEKEIPSRPAIDELEQPIPNQESESSTAWEILKSIVYGGLVEFIASLGIVTSSASSDATTLNILVLSLANLIGGFFVIVNNMWDLKSEQPRTNNVTNVRVDRYYEVLGKRKHFYLHVFIAILSFIIFGLVPPLVYAFTFTESNNKDLKLAAVAVASAICITLLSIAKAHIQRPNSYLTYLKTVLQYLSTAAMTSVVSYLAGELVKELIQKLGWFDTKSSSFTLLLPEMMSVEKPRFGSY